MGNSSDATRYRYPRIVLAVAVVLLAAIVVVVALASRATPVLKRRATAALAERFDAHVELDDLSVTIFPAVRVSGGGLRLTPQNARDRSPMIEVGRFSAQAGLWGLLSTPIRIRRVEVSELVVRVPPRAENQPADESASPTDIPEGLAIDTIQADRARLEILTAKPGKDPRIFQIHNLTLKRIGRGQPMAFTARLTNPAPKGEIDTSGHFGPWRQDAPSVTAVNGKYTFTHADLGTFKGIAGILASKGEYTGVLERISVKGTTDTPDFQIDTGSPVPLKTTFDATVDGTNGNTYLTRVDAVIAGTPLTARGAIAGVEGRKGREIRLDVTIPGGRIEDVLRLAIRTDKPPLLGGLTMEAKLLIPPGPEDVVDKLQLEGTFEIDEGRFTDLDVQKKLLGLSRRARGQLDASGDERVVSDMGARFTMQDGRVRLSPVVFTIRGATVRLRGAYNIRSEQMDFKGDLLLQAKLSQTVGGWKSWLVKPFDPLFRDGKHTVVPITVSGSREQPKFGLDVKRALTPGE
jgi:hypothetical protein